MKQLEQTLTSMEVAEMIGKTHKNLIRSIETYIKHFTELKIEPSGYFKKSTYKDASGKENKCYNITKNGCELIAHKLTGVKGTAFTVQFINRFHDMEEALQQIQPALPQQETYLLRNSPTWFQRNNSKMKMICDYFYWTRKHLYHKILQEVSDIYSLENVEELFISDYGKRPFYKMDLIEYYPPLQEVANSYIDHLMNFIEE